MSFTKDNQKDRRARAVDQIHRPPPSAVVQHEPGRLDEMGVCGPEWVSRVCRGRFRVRQGNPGVPIVESTLLADYDAYYHPRDRKPPLPVLRVKFADPAATWFYIDPRMSQVVTRFTRRERLQRWIYNGLHSLDFNFWYYQGPVWQTTMVALNAGGAVLSVIGVILAVKRLARNVKPRMTRITRIKSAPSV